MKLLDKKEGRFITTTTPWLYDREGDYSIPNSNYAYLVKPLCLMEVRNSKQKH
jgi:hypothetical protein